MPFEKIVFPFDLYLLHATKNGNAIMLVNEIVNIRIYLCIYL